MGKGLVSVLNMEKPLVIALALLEQGLMSAVNVENHLATVLASSHTREFTME